MSEQTGVKLIISELEKSFGELKVLRKIDIQIAPGEFVAIVGKSGCGKSTLLRHIAGLEEQNAGQIKQDNAQVVDRKSTRLNSSHVATSYAVFCLKKKNKQRKDK